MVDKDRPSTWKKYDPSLCASCKAHCCRMPVEVKLSDLIRMGIASQDEADTSIKKLAKRLIKMGYIKSYREGTEFFMLTQRANDDCYFLDPYSRLCTIYEKRPDTCRKFPAEIGPRIGLCPSEKK